MRRAFVGLCLLVLSGCGKTDSSHCSDVICPGEGRGDCVDLSTDPDNCGECGIRCKERETCEFGRCLGCPNDEERCGTVCADLLSSAAHCGDCWQDCQGEEQCIDGSCQAPSECGDEACAGEQVCVDGACETPPECPDGLCDCEEGTTQCGQRCFDLSTSTRHCGDCTNICASGLRCVEGECQCPDGLVDCWDGCLDPTSDPLNCGACGALCENSTFCEDGVCRCPDGLTSCDGTCVDAQTSRFHCGACSQQCSGTETCFEGNCRQAPADTACVEVPGDIEIRRVTLYQGVEVDLALGVDPIDPAERAVDIVRGRDALIRVFVNPGPNFEASVLAASLELEGAEVRTFRSQPTDITQRSSLAELGSTLNIFVPGEAIVQNLEYSVQLWACQEASGGSVGAVRVPETGTASLTARRSGELTVRFIPVVHDDRVPDTSSEVLDLYAREVMRQYPATALNWDLGEPLVSDETGIFVDLGLILDQVTERRDEDSNSDDIYYYGIVDPAPSLQEYCDGGCTTGIAWWLPTVSDWALAHRVGVGIGFGTYGANTFAHELGHNLGRDHAPCNTDGDADYPYANASIGVWGYDPVAGILKDPNLFADLMSYCEPNWVSDYTYDAIFRRIAFTQLPSSRGGPESHELVPTQTWASFVVTNGGAKWGRTRARPGAPSDSPEEGVVYDANGTAIAEVEVHRIFMADGGGYKLFVPERQPGWFAVGLVDGIALPYN